MGADIDPRELEYRVVDVFADGPFAGNPLAVVLGGDGLTTAQCQALAREFHLSETAFPLPASGGGDYRVRIFTPAAEMPFAGHPSVGTAWVLARLGTLRPGRAVQDCAAGTYELDVPADADDVVTLRAPRLEVSGPVDAGPLLAAVGLGPDDLTGMPARTAGAGVRFGYLDVRPGALARVVPDKARLAALIGITGVSVACRDAAAGDVLPVAVRVLAADIGEDPATGSAALGLGAWLAADGLVPTDATTPYAVRQGAEIGRPSRLECTVTTVAGRPVAGTVGGRVAAVARGRIVRPAGQ